MKQQSPVSPKRKLGDEWINWKVESQNIDDLDSEAGKKLYLGFSALTVMTYVLFAYALNYLIEPRLSQLHPILPKVSTALLMLFIAILGVWYVLMMISILSSRNLILPIFGNNYFYIKMAPVVLKLGRQLGISRDKLSNSFIKVSNSIVKTVNARSTRSKPLVLLPRCLQKKQLSQITSFAKEVGCPVHIVSGGEAARRILSQEKPTSVVGVACERDLLSGIQDVINSLPVIGIANKRPEGPCKNTVVDFEKVKDAIRFFSESTLKKDRVHPSE